MVRLRVRTAARVEPAMLARQQPHLEGASSSGGSASSVEVYGFAAWIAARLGMVLFLLWAFLPTSYLHAMGVTYYPDRQWAIIVPAWVLASLTFVAWSYESANQMSVRAVSSTATIQDVHCKSHRDLGLTGVEDATDDPASVMPLAHIHAAVVSRVLFGGRAVADAVAEEERWRAAAGG
ncbi:hypothetical protein FOA52_007063 [Chlamydomonas sp. UWO 241]|nr:hypothetical protein FOA52_007063 [Chlamydomonas sp. UWO 241]